MANRPGPELPRLSPSEWVVFSLISKTGPLRISDMLKRLPEFRPGFSTGYTTVLKFCQRLMDKGYLTGTPEGRSHVMTFSAAVDFQDALCRQFETFLSDHIFDADDATTDRLALARHLKRFS